MAGLAAEVKLPAQAVLNLSPVPQIFQQLQTDLLAFLRAKLRGGFNYFPAKDSTAGTARLVRPLNL
jgi:hypothetical protein